RSRALYLNETGDPLHNLTLEYNDFIGMSAYQQPFCNALIDWFLENEGEFDELHISGSGRSIPKQAVEARRLQISELTCPGYRVELCNLAGGEILSVLSSNSRQQLRRAMRRYESYGRLGLRRARSAAEAQTFFEEMKGLHTASWET